MKHVLWFLFALLIGLGASLAASRSHRPHHVSDARARKAEGMVVAPALVSREARVIEAIDGAGRLRAIAPASPGFERRSGGMIIPDDESVGRLELPRAGRSGSVMQELVIRD